MAFDPYWFRGARPWRFDQARTGGGVVIDGSSHWLRPLRMWLGEIDEVVAALGHHLQPMEGESLARARAGSGGAARRAGHVPVGRDQAVGEGLGLGCGTHIRPLDP